MSDLHISWTEYYTKIETLATKIYESQWQFNQIVCLARGGLRVGDILSRMFEQPMAILATSSYGGTGGQVRGAIKVAEHMTMTTDTLGSHVLLVDDLVDSGISLKESINWLKTRYPDTIQDLKSAVLWHKSCSIIAPDYSVDYLPDNPWIHQPFEYYENWSFPNR